MAAICVIDARFERPLVALGVSLSEQVGSPLMPSTYAVCAIHFHHYVLWQAYAKPMRCLMSGSKSSAWRPSSEALVAPSSIAAKVEARPHLIFV